MRPRARPPPQSLNSIEMMVVVVVMMVMTLMAMMVMVFMMVMVMTDYATPGKVGARITDLDYEDDEDDEDDKEEYSNIRSNVLIISDDDNQVHYADAENGGDDEEVDGKVPYPKVNLGSEMLSSCLVNLAFSWEGTFLKIWIGRHLGSSQGRDLHHRNGAF